MRSAATPRPDGGSPAGGTARRQQGFSSSVTRSWDRPPGSSSPSSAPTRSRSNRRPTVTIPDDDGHRHPGLRPASADRARAQPRTVPAIMPERLASTSPYQPVNDIVGSGPYRFLPNEHIRGAGAAFARFAEYQPRHGHPEPTLRRGYEASDLIHYRPSIASSTNFDASPCTAIVGAPQGWNPGPNISAPAGSAAIRARAETTHIRITTWTSIPSVPACVGLL